MSRVKLYTTSWCPFCINALKLLMDEGVPHENVDLTTEPGMLNARKEEFGHDTVPIILVDGELLGGFNELRALADEKGLDHLKA